MWAVAYSKTPSRLNYLRDGGLHIALGEQMRAQSISSFHFVWLHGKKVERMKGKGRCLSQEASWLASVTSPFHSQQATKLILSVRCGLSCAPVCLCRCWRPLTAYRNWRQIKARAMKRMFLDWSWHHLAFNPDLNMYHPGGFCKVVSKLEFLYL